MASVSVAPSNVAFLDQCAFDEALLDAAQAVLRLGALGQCFCEQHKSLLEVQGPTPNAAVVNSDMCAVPVCVVQARGYVTSDGIEPLQPR